MEELKEGSLGEVEEDGGGGGGRVKMSAGNAFAEEGRGANGSYRRVGEDVVVLAIWLDDARGGLAAPSPCGRPASGAPTREESVPSLPCSL